jgi:hypothetical protein
MKVFITSGLSAVLYEFDFPERYRQGDTLGEAEASALNRLIAENIARNKTGGVRRVESAVGQVLSVKDLWLLQSELATYVEEYQLVAVPSDRRGDIEREAETYRAEREHQCEPLCMACKEEGRRRVLAKAGIAQRALEDL